MKTYWLRNAICSLVTMMWWNWIFLAWPIDHRSSQLWWYFPYYRLLHVNWACNYMATLWTRRCWPRCQMIFRVILSIMILRVKQLYMLLGNPHSSCRTSKLHHAQLYARGQTAIRYLPELLHEKRNTESLPAHTIKIQTSSIFFLSLMVGAN